MCAGQLTKNVLPGGSAEPVGAHWDGKITNEWSNGNETWPNITKLKHVQNDENVMFCRKWKNILCVLRQVMQSANCELARRLKWVVLVDQLGMLFCVKWKQPWMRNEPLCSPEHLICYSSCQCILRQVMQWANCVPVRLLRHWHKMKWNWKRVEVGGIFLGIF